MLIYGHEIWVVTKRMRSQIQTGFLRRVAGLSFRDRMRSSEIRSKLRVEPPLLCIERCQLRCFGHLIRMSPGGLPLTVFQIPVHLGIPKQELENVAVILRSLMTTFLKNISMILFNLLKTSVTHQSPCPSHSQLLNLLQSVKLVKSNSEEVRWGDTGSLFIFDQSMSTLQWQYCCFEAIFFFAFYMKGEWHFQRRTHYIQYYILTCPTQVLLYVFTCFLWSFI